VAYVTKVHDKPLVGLRTEIKTPPFSKEARIEAGVFAAATPARDEIMTMDKKTRKRLESAGWKVGEASEFLGLSEDEAAIVELRVGLAAAVKNRRNRHNMTQEQLGRLLGSSQSRVAKIEAADPSVSIDLMVRSLLRMGASRKEVAACIASGPRRAA
jgi:DNA-binding XRE family transcriptional regulator